MKNGSANNNNNNNNNNMATKAVNEAAEAVKFSPEKENINKATVAVGRATRSPKKAVKFSPGKDIKNTTKAVGRASRAATKTATTKAVTFSPVARKKRKKLAVNNNNNNNKRAVSASVWLNGAGGYEAGNGEYVMKANEFFVRKGGPVLMPGQFGYALFKMAKHGYPTNNWQIQCEPLEEPWNDYTFAVWECPESGGSTYPPQTGWVSLIQSDKDGYTVPTSNPTVSYK